MDSRGLSAGVKIMNDLKLVVRQVYKQLQYGLGCAKNCHHNKTWPHGVLEEREIGFFKQLV